MSVVDEVFMKKLIFCFVALFLVGTLYPDTSAQAGERLAVSVPSANIRQGAGTEYEVLWRVEKYYPVIILEKKGTWSRFTDFEGDEGWILGSLLQTLKTVVTKKDDCNVRQGPGTGYEIAFTVQRGVPFKIIGSRGKWLQLQHADGDTGWIYKPLTW